MQEFTPMQRVESAPMTAVNKRHLAENIRKAQPEISDREINEIIKSVTTAEIWKNNLYSAFVKRDVQFLGAPPNMIHLLIRRNDGQPGRNWGHFQRIKNEVLGEQIEAVELYPAERRAQKGGGEYHLWAQGQLGPDGETPGFPWGFFDLDEPEQAQPVPFQSARQGPEEELLVPGNLYDDQGRWRFVMDDVELRWDEGRAALVLTINGADGQCQQRVESGIDVEVSQSQFLMLCARASEMTAQQLAEVVQNIR